MNIGVIGTGVMGKNHARIYADLKGVDELFVYDIARNESRALSHIGTPCDTLEALLTQVDAVSICTPTPSHFIIAQQAIKAGIHCLIEKPITDSVASAYELYELTRYRDLVIGVGHIERFNPIVREITNLISEPSFFAFNRFNPASARIKHTSVVFDLMIHDIDIVLHAFMKRMPDSFNDVHTADQFIATLRFNPTNDQKRAAIASLAASRQANKKTRSVYIEDDNYTITGNFMSQEVYTFSKPERFDIKDTRYSQENIIEKIQVNKVEPLREELRTFISAVKYNRQFPITVEEAAMNVKLCHLLSNP